MPSFQLESYAQISAEDFVVFDRRDDSMDFSTVRKPRAGDHLLATVPARTSTAGEISFQTLLPYRLTRPPARSSRQNLRAFRVVLRI
ncbi:MAG: hypothetical protein WD688_23265 [Candidatus Binatia bacterium]